jgi:cell wall-associated NlpC family hydrolase
VVANAPVSPGAAGAVQAAESQLGVEYVWGGESPRGSANPGFDCSGLTQWSYAQAGVSLPRTAQDQYDAIVHVPLSDLQPGDLLFWDDGTNSVEHVAMYIGNNTVIQAPETGETVSYSPIWDNGLVGAGRP